MSGGIDYTVLFPAGSSGEPDGLLGALRGGARTAGAGSLRALRTAETNEAREVAVTARQPAVARDIAAFQAAVAKSRTPADLLKNPAALKVLLTAGGMSDQMAYTALAQRVLLSNAKDAKSLVNKMAATNARWKTLNQTYDFANKGLSVLRRPDVLSRVASGYAEVSWQQSLDAATPGLSNALTFRAQASTVTSVDQILGDPVLRDVITTALGIPREIALQSLPTQERAIANRLDLGKLKDRHFVDTLSQEYLLNKANADTTGAGAVSLEQLASRAAGLVV